MGMSQSLHQLLKTYLQYHSIEGSTADTIRHKRKEIGLFLRHLEGLEHSMLAHEVTSFDVIAHLDQMKARQLSPATVQTRYRAIRAFFQWATDWDVIPANPVAKIKSPKVPKLRKPFLDQETFQCLLDLCVTNTLVGARRQAILWVFATTGMRRRELTLLEIDDLDWQRGEIRVVHGKGQKERRVPFLKETQRVLLRYLRQRNDDHPCLWVTEENRPLGYHGLGRDLSRLFQRAGIEVKDVCHIFRRTWAANSVRQGIPRPYTQAVAGWSTPAMLDRYTAAMEAEEGAIEAFRDFDPFGGNGGGKRKGIF